MAERSQEEMLWREEVANRPKHWVRAVTACNSRCLFCLDSDTPRNVYLDEADIRAEIDRGLDELGADKLILSGGEATLHPAFVDLVRYAKERGYDRVQTVTNGYRFAERDFYQDCVAAGLGEITFSLHGHTAELHDRLTGTPDAFRRLLKGMVRAVRERRVIVNVDVVINKQNVAVIDKIVELCISLGVTEFDLLHVIPQAAAFDNRDELFYDVRDHLPVLQKVFRLNRHPRFVIWTNRFPVSYLEGLEDLIQDPHKMLDEVNGRRHQVRRYLDEGRALDCRDPERCPHCFIEPFCTTMDRVVTRQREERFAIWWLGDEAWDGTLPFGCGAVGLSLPSLADLPDRPEGVAVYAEVAEARPLPDDLTEAVLVAKTAEQLEAWLPKGGALPEGVGIDLHLNQQTAPWLLAHRDRLATTLDRLRLHQPSHEHMAQAHAEDVRDPRAFFEELALPVKVSGLPICLTPGAEWVEERAILPASIFDEQGRLAIRPLAKLHVAERYRAKSVRCADCVVNERCEGAPINMVRDQGLAPLTPLVEGEEAERARQQLEALYPEPPPRLATGSPAVGVSPSLPGHAPPGVAPEDPLALIAREQLIRKANKRGMRVEPGE